MAGIFGLAYELRDKGTLAEWEQEEIESLLGWFRMHLEIPAVLKSADNHRAICWFHPRAREPIPCTLDETTRRFGPGDYQVTAYGFDPPGSRWELLVAGLAAS